MNLMLRIYGRVIYEFGLAEFRLKDLEKLLRDIPTKTPLPLVAYRMCKAGFFEKVARGRYRAVHPLTLALSWVNLKGMKRIKQRDYVPIISLIVSRLFECLGRRLKSIVLYGSIARGKALPESDIDLLVVAEGLPSSYSERVKWLRNILRGIEEFRIELWRSKGLYPLIDIIALTPEEAKVSHPIYLDMIEDAIILFDRGIIKEKLREVKERLRALGARRVETPSGGWYWELKPDMELGEVVEI